MSPQTQNNPANARNLLRIRRHTKKPADLEINSKLSFCGLLKRWGQGKLVLKRIVGKIKKACLTVVDSKCSASRLTRSQFSKCASVYNRGVRTQAGITVCVSKIPLWYLTHCVYNMSSNKMPPAVMLIRKRTFSDHVVKLWWSVLLLMMARNRHTVMCIPEWLWFNIRNSQELLK